jgi:hypothetical protein
MKSPFLREAISMLSHHCCQRHNGSRFGPNSETIHDRIQHDPHFLVEYHEKLDEARKLWDFDPVNVIANKINGLKWPANIFMKLVI